MLVLHDHPFLEFSFCYFLPGGFLNATLCGFPPLVGKDALLCPGCYWFCEGRKGRDRLFRDPCNRPVPALIVRDVVFDYSFGLVWVGGFLNTALPT